MEASDLSAARRPNRKPVLGRWQARGIELYTDLVFLGPTEGERTHLGCALGRKACYGGISVPVERTARLLEEIRITCEQRGCFARLLKLALLPVLILDGWKRDPISLVREQDLLEVLDDRLGNTSMMVAPQVADTDWHLRIPDPTLADATLDLLVQSAIRIRMERPTQPALRSSKTAPRV
jgi:DNA replication protein DnaC